MSDMLSGVFFYLWCKNLVGLRTENRRKRGILLAIICAVLGMIGCMLNGTAAFVLSAGVLFVFGLFLCEKEYAVLLFYTLVYCILWFFADNILNLFFTVPISVFMAGILCIGVSYCFRSSGKPYAVIIYPSILMIPAVSVILEIVVYEWSRLHEKIVGLDIICFWVGLTVSVISVVLLFSIQRFSETIAEKEEWKLHVSRDTMEKAHYQKMEKQQEEYDTMIHDLKHVLRTMAVLADSNHAEEVKALAEKVNLSIDRIAEKEYCSNKILNALLTERVGFAEKKGIKLDLEIVEPLNLNRVEELDLITMIGNLLDNAILAESRVANSQGVSCRISLSRGFEHIIIRVENSYEGRLFRRRRKAEGRLGEKHGIGLNSIEDIVKKYGGIMDSAVEEGRYWTKIIIPT